MRSVETSELQLVATFEQLVWESVDLHDAAAAAAGVEPCYGGSCYSDAVVAGATDGGKSLSL